MKVKFLGLLIAAFLVFGVAGPGHASTFGLGDLIRVAYDTSTGKEVATDLGAISTILATSGTQTLGGAGALIGSTSPTTLTDLGGESSWNNVKVGYLTVLSGTNPTLSNSGVYVASTQDSVTSKGSSGGYGGMRSGLWSMITYWQGYSATQKAIAPTGGISTHSYWGVMNGGGLWFAGTYNNWLSSSIGGEITPVASSAVGQNLFGWIGSSTQSLNGTPLPGTLEGVLETYVDGSGNLYTTYQNAAPVPLPPSAILLLPGLLGLIGLRRKIWS